MTAGSNAFADAPTLDPVQASAIHDVGPSSSSTTEVGEPLGSPTIDRTRWLKFVPAVDGRFGYVSLVGTTGPARWVRLYSGDGTIGGLVERASLFSDNESWAPLSYVMTAGQSYWLQVGTEAGDPDSEYRLQLQFEKRVLLASDWIQGDDFTRSMGPLNTSPGGRLLSGAQRNAYGADEVLAAPGGFDDATLGAVENAALIRDQDGPNAAGVTTDPVDLLMNVSYGYFEDDNSSNYYAWSQANAWYFSATAHRLPDPVDIPDGYDSVEWEAEQCDVVGGTAIVPAVNGSFDESTDPPSPVMSGDWTTKVVAPNNVVWTTPGAPGDPDELDYIEDHDMSVELGLPVASFPSGRVIDPAVTTETADVSDAIDEYGRVTLLVHLDSSDFEAPMPAAYTPNLTNFTFGALLSDPSVDMVMRPPRHRFTGETWVTYAGGTTTGDLDFDTQPPLRQRPRGDGLGWSSATRLFPQARTVQRSNRRLGGHIR